MRLYDERMWGRLMLLVIVGLLAVSVFSGCRSTKYVPLEKVVYRESVKHDTLHKRDSIYIRDSVSTSQKGDTIFLDRWHRETILKEVYRNKTDSLIKRDSIPVPYPVEKELSKWEQFELKYAIWSMGALCMVLVWLGYKLYKWIKNAKLSFHNKQG